MIESFMGKTMIKVLCVDDSPDIARLMHMSIDAEPDLSSVGFLLTADDLVDEVARSKPNVVLLDLTMPGKSPLAALGELNEAHPETKTIVYSGYDDEESITRAVDSGAWGYVSKHHDLKAILDAIRRVAGGELVLDR